MALTAKEICRTIRLVPALRDAIRDHALAIDDRIRRAPGALGANCVVHELPARFMISGLSNAQAQTVIYSTILRSLTKRGFDVRIRIEDLRAYLYIRWFTELSVAEDDAMVALIRAHSIKPDEVGAFMGGEGGPRATDAPKAAKPFSLAGPAARKPQPRGGIATRPQPAAARKGPSPAEVALLGAGAT
ncbi:MAG TPA: hypothetical protein VNI01_14150 [Elusimicrobiota bacterium]|nr:hypothetical protein [Elusimicrobiota bacterium]